MRPAVFFLLLCLASVCRAQGPIDQGQAGAWYTYAFADAFTGSRFGWQGDIQQRLWDIDEDLDQTLVRTGLTYTPTNSTTRYTLGTAFVRSGAFGPSSADSEELRLYQEAFIPQKAGERFYFTHRWRLEQRWVEGQDTRNRLRYFLGLNYPLNQSTLGQGAIYLSLYNELFVNLEQEIGNGRQVDYFDRNRFYAALGYSVSDRTRLQFGYMHQETDNVGKGQLQFNLIQNF